VATMADAGAVRALVERAYGMYVQRIGRRPAPMDADYEALIGRAQVVLAELDGAPVGVLVLVPRPGHLLLENIAVDPAFQGRGVGRQLMQLAEQRAVQAGLPEVRLYTNQLMTENLAWYPALGYREVSRGEQDGFRRVFFRKRV